MRKDADDLLELVIEPALEKFDFDVVRADRIAGSAAITTEIIALVQNAELCVIDLTNQNANVYYECGRRHETGKPFIQLIRKGDTLPFDVAGIRTIGYDLVTPRTVSAAIKALQGFVETFEAEQFVNAASGGSIATVGEVLDRVERKLDKLVASVQVPATVRASEQQSILSQFDFPGMRQQLSPSRAFMLAAARGDNAEMATQLRRLREVEEDKEAVLAAAGAAASRGVDEGAVMISDVLDTWPEEYQQVTRDDGLLALSGYYVYTNQEEEGLARLLPELERCFREATDGEKKSNMANQIQKLYWGTRQYEEALEWAIKAIESDPDEPTLRLNASMIYDARELLDLAEAEIEKAIELSGDQPSPQVLEHACDIYWKRGKEVEANATLQRLAIIDRAAAELKAFERRLKG